MRDLSRVVLVVLTASLSGCGDINLGDWSGFTTGFGPSPRELPASTARFEPRSLALRVGETADVTLRLDPGLKSVILQWWGHDEPLMRVADFACEPEGSCGLVSFAPDERAALQLLNGRALRMRVTGTAVGQDGVRAHVNTCVPSHVFCEDQGSAYLLVEVRP
jgi:hypothetical protein